MGKVLALQTREPEFGPQNPHKNTGIVACAYDHHAEELTGRDQSTPMPLASAGP